MAWYDLEEKTETKREYLARIEQYIIKDNKTHTNFIKIGLIIF